MVRTFVRETSSIRTFVLYRYNFLYITNVRASLVTKTREIRSNKLYILFQVSIQRLTSHQNISNPLQKKAMKPKYIVKNLRKIIQ